jgi:predicted CxxxxCH...CXXCH cytochrome family protein
MVNQTVKLFTFAVLLLIPSVVFALPGAHDPLTGGQGFTCNSCHVSGKTIGNRDETYVSNVCLTCHTTGDPKTKKQFTANDFSNPFVGTTVPQSNPIQSSHKWFGTDTVPAAGAQPPSDTTGLGLNKAGYTGYVSCGRCHNVHGTSGAESLNAPYLRSVNNSDEMCRNCHAPRDTTSHVLGSHPVNINYTSASAKAKIAAGELLATPVTNSANPTGQVKLIDGKVLCSTCHGVHTADSNSATFDAFTSGHAINTSLTPSNGALLRVDPYGATANATNVCTNCHAQKRAHDGKGQNVQCNDCHSGHVEYDAAATGAEKTPNVYLVRRYLQYTTAGRPSKRIVYNSTTTKNFYNSNGTGVCQSCHKPTAAEHFLADGVTLKTDHTDCTTCHKHYNSSKPLDSAWSAGNCTSCHGQPPSTNTTGGPTGAAAGYTKFNESLTPHTTHSGGTDYNFACNQCHNTYTDVATHNTTPKTYQSVLNAPTGFLAGSTAAYNATTSTCSTVYCHSDGKGGFKTGVTWGNNKGSITGCTACHDTTTYSTGHTKHITTLGYGCVACHAATVSDNTTLIADAKKNGGAHVNAVKDIKFTGLATGTNCSTNYCHSNGKGAAPTVAPVWATAATGSCGACHAVGIAKTIGTTNVPALASGSHTTHFVGNTLQDSNCAKCHEYTTEVSAKHVDGTLQAGTGCATTACHGSITAPAWGANTSNDSCTKCHGTGTATGVITPAANNRYLVAPDDPAATAKDEVSSIKKTGAHQTHLRYLNGFSNYSTVDYRCATCHTVPTTGTTHVDSNSVPVFTKIAVKGGLTANYDPTSASCSNVYCHNPKAALLVADAGTAMVPVWTDSTYLADSSVKSVANCQKCHLVPGSASFTKQTAHGTMVTDATVNQCSGCHGHNGDNTGALGQRHLDGILYKNDACDTCHGYPPVSSMTGLGVANNFANAKIENYAGGGGKHTIHLPATLVASAGFTPCLPCHPDSGAGFHHNVSTTVAQANVNVNTATGDATDLAYRFDSSRARRYNATAKTCSNVSCHFQPTAAW